MTTLTPATAEDSDEFLGEELRRAMAHLGLTMVEVAPHGLHVLSRAPLRPAYVAVANQLLRQLSAYDEEDADDATD